MTDRTHACRAAVSGWLATLVCVCVVLAALSCKASRQPQHRAFATPEEAVNALIQAAKAGNEDQLRSIFGPDVQELVDSSDPPTARRRREVFIAAAREGWRLTDQGAGKTLVVGNENWPFPVPLVKDADGWRFDTAAGKEEVLARQIGRNELAVIQICGTYVIAQRLYAQHGHDGKPAGIYAASFRSDPGRQNGLYWPARHGEKRSPLGDLVAQAGAEGTRLDQNQAPSPFHGYYFKILTGQGGGAAGGAKPYVVNGAMSGGFALVAWPAQYDTTGVMTFLVNQDGIVRQKDLGSGTDAAAKAMTLYNPDASWEPVQ